jgi:hypothetical protein
MNAETSKAGKTTWAFDLGKGSIGEAVRCGDKFLHKASLLIPAEFAGKKKGLFRLRGSPVWKSSFTLRLAAWLFPTIDTARLVLIRSKFSHWIL